MTASSSSREPSRLTMECDPGMTILVWTWGGGEAVGGVGIGRGLVAGQPAFAFGTGPPSLAGWPAQVASSEHVGVSVEHRLARVPAGVEDHPVATLGQALGGRTASAVTIRSANATGSAAASAAAVG